MNKSNKRITKGVILAGGHGTRLRPITNYINKHLVPVFDRPMIEYPLATLKSCGIEDILIVSGREHAGDFLEYLGAGNDYCCNFTYKVQDKIDGKYGGIAQALGLAKDFIGNDETFAVVLGDNIFGDSMDLSLKDGKEAKVFLKKVNDADRFGVARFDINKEIESIVEKPKDIKHGYAVTGLYVYPNSVFDVVSRMRPSARGELEITDVNQYYARMKMLDYEILDGYWSDAGTPESLARSTQWAIKRVQEDIKNVKD